MKRMEWLTIPRVLAGCTKVVAVYDKPTRTDRRPSSSWEGVVESGRDAFPAGGRDDSPCPPA